MGWNHRIGPILGPLQQDMIMMMIRSFPVTAVPYLLFVTKDEEVHKINR